MKNNDFTHFFKVKNAVWLALCNVIFNQILLYEKTGLLFMYRVLCYKLSK